MKYFKKGIKSMTYKQNKSTIHPALKLIILLAVYALGYICGSINQKQTETVISENINQKLSEAEAKSNNSYNEINETNSSDNEIITSKYTITYAISYSELNKNEKELYDKIISTAMNKDNTFITDKELSFNLNSEISENESIRVQSVFYNNYPDVTIYTTRYSDAWMYHVTHLLNGVPLYRTYYFNVKYKK